MAILFPDTDFTLVDSIGKKIKMVNAVAEELGLTNITGIHKRAEEIPSSFDFVISRAVTRMNAFLPLVKGKFKKKNLHERANGILYLKGGDLKEEMNEINWKHEVVDLETFFKSEFFETKKSFTSKGEIVVISSSIFYVKTTVLLAGFSCSQRNNSLSKIEK